MEAIPGKYVPVKSFPAGGVGLCSRRRASGGSGLERDLSLSSGERPPTTHHPQPKEPKITIQDVDMNFDNKSLNGVKALVNPVFIIAH